MTETKQELRDTITSLEQKNLEQKIQIKNLNDSLVNAYTTLDKYKKFADTLMYVIQDQIQEMIDKSMKSLSLDIDCDYGGYVTGTLNYKGNELSVDTGQVIEHYNSLEE